LPYKFFSGDWGILANDEIGDCVFAGAGHEHMLWESEAGNQVVFPVQNIIRAYSDVTGYSPSNSDSDNGTNVRLALRYRRNVGIFDSNNQVHKLDSFLQIHNKNIQEMKTALFLFDAVGIGINFPSTAMGQFQNGQPWDVVSGSSIEGGHYVPIVGYDENFIYVVTWGQIQRMTYAFYNQYNDEAWAILSQDFLKNGKSPDGFDFETLKQDLVSLC
jgi:hypothetical protein